MSATSRLYSPTTNLLRGSRLFALPHPLPPSSTNASAQPAPHSDTATSPYPTHAAIETTKDARDRGEWGLKRALPLKSTTKTGTPYIRIKDGIDTREHITNFEQASDHVLTLRKFQTLDIPVVLPDTEGAGSTPFEEKYHSVLNPRRLSKDSKRWTTEGPWLAGMSNMDFEWWLNGGRGSHPGVIRRDKVRFLQHVRRDMVAEIIQKELAQEADGEGSSASVLGQEWVENLTEDNGSAQKTGSTAAELQSSLQLLRDDIRLLHGQGKVQLRILEEIMQRDGTEQRLSSLLRNYVRLLRVNPPRFLPLLQQFFDLPDTPETNGRKSVWKFGPAEYNTKQSSIASRAYTEVGMPSTHPSAGLGYLRTSSISHNHPLYGPQERADPIPARILKTGAKSSLPTRGTRAKLGAAGFVTDLGKESHITEEAIELGEFTPKPGGSKYPVTPSHVVINPDGSPILTVRSADNAKKIMAGLKKEADVEEYLGRRKAAIRSFDEMPQLDSNYSANNEESRKRLSRSLANNRRGLSAMLGQSSQSSRDNEQKANDLLDSMITQAR